MNFKAGDKVRVLDKTARGWAGLGNSSWYRGDTGFVTEVQSTRLTVSQMMNTHRGGDYFNPKDLQLIKGEQTMGRRTFRLLKELPGVKKGALIQEACDDGDQDYTLLDETNDKYPNGSTIQFGRESVEGEPKWYEEVFPATTEYLTKTELANFKKWQKKQK